MTVKRAVIECAICEASVQPNNNGEWVCENCGNTGISNKVDGPINLDTKPIDCPVCHDTYIETGLEDWHCPSCGAEGTFPGVQAFTVTCTTNIERYTVSITTDDYSLPVPQNRQSVERPKVTITPDDYVKPARSR